MQAITKQLHVESPADKPSSILKMSSKPIRSIVINNPPTNSNLTANEHYKQRHQHLQKQMNQKEQTAYDGNQNAKFKIENELSKRLLNRPLTSSLLHNLTSNSMINMNNVKTTTLISKLIESKSTNSTSNLSYDLKRHLPNITVSMNSFAPCYSNLLNKSNLQINSLTSDQFAQNLNVNKIPVKPQEEPQQKLSSVKLKQQIMSQYVKTNNQNQKMAAGNTRSRLDSGDLLKRQHLNKSKFDLKEALYNHSSTMNELKMGQNQSANQTNPSEFHNQYSSNYLKFKNNQLKLSQVTNRISTANRIYNETEKTLNPLKSAYNRENTSPRLIAKNSYYRNNKALNSNSNTNINSEANRGINEFLEKSIYFQQSQESFRNNSNGINTASLNPILVKNKSNLHVLNKAHQQTITSNVNNQKSNKFKYNSIMNLLNPSENRLDEYSHELMDTRYMLNDHMEEFHSVDEDDDEYDEQEWVNEQYHMQQHLFMIAANEKKCNEWLERHVMPYLYSSASSFTFQEEFL
jgi:hypothetical protein